MLRKDEIKYVMIRVPLSVKHRQELDAKKIPGRSQGAWVAQAIVEKLERENEK